MRGNHHKHHRRKNGTSRRYLSLDAGDRVSMPKLRNVKVKLEPDRLDLKGTVSRVNQCTVVANNKISVPDSGSEISNQRATFIERRVDIEDFLCSLAN